MGTQLKLRDGVKNYYNSNKIMMDLELGWMGLQDIRVHLEMHLHPATRPSAAVIYIMGHMVNANILIFTVQDEVWTNTKDPINMYKADMIFTMTVLRTFLPLEASKATDQPWLQKVLGQGQIRPRLPPQITEMLMQVVQAQVAEVLEDKVQVVDMVPAPAQQQQRGRWAPTAMVTRAQARQQQQQQ